MGSLPFTDVLAKATKLDPIPEPYTHYIVRCLDGEKKNMQTTFESQITFCLFYHRLGLVDFCGRVMSNTTGINGLWFIMDSSIIKVSQAVVWQKDC